MNNSENVISNIAGVLSDESMSDNEKYIELDAIFKDSSVGEVSFSDISEILQKISDTDGIDKSEREILYNSVASENYKDGFLDKNDTDNADLAQYMNIKEGSPIELFDKDSNEKYVFTYKDGDYYSEDELSQNDTVVSEEDTIEDSADNDVSDENNIPTDSISSDTDNESSNEDISEDINSKVYSEVAYSKYNSMFEAYSEMDDYSADKEHASELLSSLQMGFVPLEMRMGASSTDFIKDNPDFKFGVQVKSQVENDNGSKNVYETNAIKSIVNENSDPLIGNDFGSFMGIDTTRTHYLKEDGSVSYSSKDAKDFKSELESYFKTDYFKEIDKVYINVDTTRTPKTADNEPVRDDRDKIIQYQHKDFKLGSSATVKDFTSLEIATFEVHKNDGSVDYKSFFANNAGDILAEIPNSGNADILLSDARDSRCEALNTVKIEGNPPRHYMEQFRERSVVSMEAANVIQSGRITYNAISAENDVEKYSDMKEKVKTFTECLYAVRNDIMAERVEAYTKIDSLAKEIAGDMKYLDSLDKSSVSFETGKEALMDKIDNFNGLVSDYHERFDNAEYFDNEKLSDAVSAYNEISNRLAGAEERVSYLDSEIVMLSTADGEKVDTETAFRGLINMERPTEIGSNVENKLNSFDGNDIKRGFDHISNKVDEWNKTHSDNPLKINTDNNRVYDKHGLERNIQDNTYDFRRGFDPSMIEEGATHPDIDEDGNYKDEDLDKYVAEDEDTYKEFSEEFNISDINIKDVDSLIDFYIGNDKVDLEEFGFERKETDNIEDHIDKNDDDEKNKNNPTIRVDLNNKRSPSTKEETDENGDKISSKTRVDINGKIELSDEKKSKIEKECYKELKGANIDKSDPRFEKLYKEKVASAEKNIKEIASDMTEIQGRIDTRQDKFGRLAGRNTFTAYDKSKIDELSIKYKKAGGAIGEGSIVTHTPTLAEGFASYMEFMNSNIFDTLIMEALGKIDERNDKKNKADNDKDKTTNSDTDKTSNDEKDFINKDLDGQDIDALSNDNLNDMENENPNDIENGKSDNADNNEPDKADNEKPDYADKDKASDIDKDTDNKIENGVEDKSDKDSDFKDDDKDKEILNDNDKTDISDSDKISNDEDNAVQSESDNNADITSEEPEEEINLDTDSVSEDTDSVDIIEDSDIEDDDISEENDISDKDVEGASEADNDNISNDTDNDEKDTDKITEDEDIKAVTEESDDDTVENEEPDEKLVEDDDDSDTDNDADNGNGKDDTDIPEEYDDDADVEAETDSNDDISSDSGEEGIKDKIDKIISNYFEDSDTIYDKLTDILDGGMSVSEILDMITDSITDFFEKSINDFESMGSDAYDSFIEKAGDLISTISDAISEYFDVPSDTTRTDFIDSLPDEISGNIDSVMNEHFGTENELGELYGTSVENSSYGDIDFDTYDSSLNDFDYNYDNIEQGIKDNPTGNDTKPLESEIEQSIDKDSLISDLISNGGYSVEDAINIADLASDIQDKLTDEPNNISSDAINTALEEYNMAKNADVDSDNYDPTDMNTDNVDSGTNTDTYTDYQPEIDIDAGEAAALL